MDSMLRIGMLIHRNAALLGPEVVKVADEALAAHEQGTYSLCATKAGACLEGLLSLMLARWNVPFAKSPTLGPLIGAARDSGHAPSELLERLNEACVIRNRVPHLKPFRLLETTEGDSLQIISILALVVRWIEETSPADHLPAEVDALPVFLSVGNPHRLDQQQFLQHSRGQMRGLGVALRSLSGGYSADKPFDQICAVMRDCRAALIVGLDRSHAYTVFEREQSDREKVHLDQYVPTAWNQIEGSIASALQLPILVLREKRLQKEGIFEAEVHRHRIRDFDLAAESRGLSDDLREFLAGWVQYVRAATAPR